jgi:K(+)-stimulated pyrophosphate-energized sodium pump
MATWVPFAVAGIAAFCLAVAAVFAVLVLREKPGNEKMRSISRAIQEGTRVFIRREYGYIAIFVVVIFFVITIALRGQSGWQTALCYVFGALCSLGAGYIGLWISTRANSRAAEAARGGVSRALTVAFRSGAVMGLTVAGLALLGLTICYIIFEVVLGVWNSTSIILGFSLGASSVGLFARVGGGIFTKGADVGAVLVCRSDSEIPERDLRNPAVIADNVGDNVGDVAGMGADLFESFVAALIAPIAIASSGLVFQKLGAKGMILPLAITGAGVACCIIGTLLVHSQSGGRSAQRALTWSTYATGALAMVSSFFIVWAIAGWDYIGFFYSLLMGIVAGIVIGLVSEYFTSPHYRPVKELVKSAEFGDATVVLRGLSSGMMSTLVPITVVALAMGVSFWTANRALKGAGLFGIGLSALGMLCTVGMVVAIDAYGPVADNAGNIAEMAGMDPEIKEITDNLDSVGNTTSALGKGLAIGAAALAALALFAAYASAVGLTTINILTDYKFLVGLLLGGVLPFVFSALIINAVGRAASAVVEEVRRQFREIVGLAEGLKGVEADYQGCVRSATDTAIYEMIVPGSLAIIAPLLVGLLLGKQSLAGFLAGALLTGFLLAVTMANSGAAWDNTRNTIEAEAHCGKETLAHGAAITGKTVGEPLKDASGPSMNILINVMSVVSLLFVPLFLK